MPARRLAQAGAAPTKTATCRKRSLLNVHVMDKSGAAEAPCPLFSDIRKSALPAPVVRQERPTRWLFEPAEYFCQLLGDRAAFVEERRKRRLNGAGRTPCGNGFKLLAQIA